MSPKGAIKKSNPDARDCVPTCFRSAFPADASLSRHGEPVDERPRCRQLGDGTAQRRKEGPQRVRYAWNISLLCRIPGSAERIAPAPDYAR